MSPKWEVKEIWSLELLSLLRSPDALWGSADQLPLPIGYALHPRPLTVHQLPTTLSCTDGEGFQGRETPVGWGEGVTGAVPQEH